MPLIRFARIAIAIAVSMVSGSCLAKAQVVTPTKPGPEGTSSNSLLEMRATRYASDEDEIFLRRRGVPDEWRGRVFVSFKNVSRSTVRLIYEHWFYDYSIEIVDSSGSPVQPTERWRGSTENTSGVITHASVSDLLPGETHVDMINLSEAYPIKPTDSYTIKIRRRRGLPTKDAAGTLIPNSELACTVTIAATPSNR
jgi:hypothetical protein